MVRHNLLNSVIYPSSLVPSVLYPQAYTQSSQAIALQHSTFLNILPPTSDSQSEVTASLKVGIVFHRAELGFAIRVDDLHSYVDVNRRVRFCLAISYAV